MTDDAEFDSFESYGLEEPFIFENAYHHLEIPRFEEFVALPNEVFDAETLDINNETQQRRKRNQDFLEAEEEDETYLQNIRRQQIMMAIAITMTDKAPEEKQRRSKRRKLDRYGPWAFIQTWSDQLFKRQFRMDRVDFFSLRDKCIKKFPGNCSSGEENYFIAQRFGDLSGGFIPLEIKLCITLRLLAGASYLDMIWYGGQKTVSTKCYKKTKSLILI